VAFCFGDAELTWGAVACGIAALSSELTTNRILFAMALMDLTGSEVQSLPLLRPSLKPCLETLFSLPPFSLIVPPPAVIS